jgi:cell division protein FtsI/penicillin-binding protein 2
VFEPGGLLKPLVAAAALERGTITTENRINCEQGVWTYKGLPLRDPSPQGELTPAEILQKSSNIGMAKIGLLLGEGSLYEAVVGWGMTQRCAAGLNTSELGLLHATNHWSKLEVTRLPIGHSCAVTLLQLLRAYSALFNDGRMVEPTLIAATRTAPGTDWYSVSVTKPKSVIRPETAAWLRTTLKKDLGDGLSTIGQPAIVQKTLANDTGYDPAHVLTAFIGSLDFNGTPHLIAVWLDEPTRDSDPNPAVGVFRKTVLKMTNDYRK